ncbi:hypothetical protein KAR91_34275 [Candidatus Pacearchaeota archaeon]|nr:hypothetical protein [Candidatus Pacearchaeota archaeon]
MTTLIIVNDTSTGTSQGIIVNSKMSDYRQGGGHSWLAHNLEAMFPEDNFNWSILSSIGHKSGVMVAIAEEHVSDTISTVHVYSHHVRNEPVGEVFTL